MSETSSDVTRAPDKDQGNSPAFIVTKPINLLQLDYEVKEAMGWRTPAGIVVDGGSMDSTTGVITPDETDEDAVVLVTHDNADARKIGAVLRAHEAVEGWTPPDAPDYDLDALAAKVLDGNPLDEVEMHAVIVGLLKERNKG